MKNLKTLICALALNFISGALSAQTDTTNTQIMMRTFEYSVGSWSSEIVLSYGSGKTERIELESLKSKNWEKNAARINYVVNKIRKNGYKLLTSHGGGDNILQASTYIFIKE